MMHHKKGQVASVTFKRLLTWDGPATGRLCAHKVHMWYMCMHR
jgi:hypothetical protein